MLTPDPGEEPPPCRGTPTHLIPCREPNAAVGHHGSDTWRSPLDIVEEAPDGGVVGIEVKAAATVRAGDLRGLRELESALEERLRLGVVLYDGDPRAVRGPAVRGAGVLPLGRVTRFGLRRGQQRGASVYSSNRSEWVPVRSNVTTLPSSL